MEADACNKDLIHAKRKKKKGKIEENHLSDHDQKSKKSKKSRKMDYENYTYNEHQNINVTKQFDEVSKTEIGDDADNNMQNLNKPAIIKKKKKRKVHLVENPDIEVDYDDKCQDYDEVKYKKKKKKSKKNLETSKIQKVNGEVEPRLSAETNDEITNSAADTESISSLYSHNYTNDSKNLDYINDKSCSRKKKMYKPQMYEDFMYKLPVIEEKSCGKIEKIPESSNYWVKQNLLYDVDNYPQEEIQKDLLERMENITDYFDRFDSGNLTKEECQEKELSNFNGPYLPTPQHVKYFSDLNIEIDWEVPAEQQLLFRYAGYVNANVEKKMGLSIAKHPFLKSEDQIMLDNWRKFQEQYKFNDLRPLLGFRTMRVNHECEQYLFEKVDYLDSNERYNFLLYIARGLEKRTRNQVLIRIIHIAMRIQDNEIKYESTHFQPREVAEIEAFIILFGAHFPGMEFFLGRVDANRYKIFSKIHIKYKNVPMRHGAWQSTERSRLVRAVFRATNASSIQELLNSKVKWAEVFPLFQTRSTYHCQSYFKGNMKERLEIASHIANHETDEAKLNWTSNDMIKLLNLVSDNLGPTCEKTDWDKISSYFEVFGPHSCKRRFSLIYQRKVPYDQRTSFRAAVDYIITYIVPQIERGSIVFKTGAYTKEALQSLPLSKDQSAKSSHDWSLKNTIKLIKEVYENAGSSVETTNWSEISSRFKNYDEESCRNSFRYLYFNRVPHEHRASFDNALEYLKKTVCPMLKEKKKRNKRESLLTEEVANFSAEDRSILQALQNDLSQADDDEDIAMLQGENLSQKITRMNELADYIQERQERVEIDGDLEDFNKTDVDCYLDDLEKEENLNFKNVTI